MSNSSRMACSLAPAYFHHWRSSASIFWSRSLSLLEESSSASRANLRASADPATPHLFFLLPPPAVGGPRLPSRACLPAGFWTACRKPPLQILVAARRLVFCAGRGGVLPRR